MKDFKIDFRLIKEDETYSYFVCLNYIGQNYDLIDSIEYIKEQNFFYEDLGDNPAYNPEDYCLFSLTLTIGKIKFVEGLLEADDDGKDAIAFSMKSDCHLGGLYNKTIDNELNSFDEIKGLKGYGEVMLCLVLNDIIRKGLLDKNSTITLEASGRIEGKSMEGLVKYYEKLGFKQAYPELLQLGLKNSLVPMKASISDIIEKCAISDKSNEIEKVMKDLIVREF